MRRGHREVERPQHSSGLEHLQAAARQADLAIDGRLLNRAADREVDVGVSRQQEGVDRQHLEEGVDVALPSDRAFDRAGLFDREHERLDGEANGGGQARAQGHFAETSSGQIDVGAAGPDAGCERGAQRRRARPNPLPDAGQTDAGRPRLDVRHRGRRRSRKTGISVDHAASWVPGWNFSIRARIEIAHGQPALDLLRRLRRSEGGLRLAVRKREFIDLQAISADDHPRRPDQPQRFVLRAWPAVAAG